MGIRYRERVAEIREGVRGEIAAGQVAAGRAALDEGDAERALHLLRSLVLSPETPSPYREAAADGIAVAIRSYALGADPAFEGVTVAAGEVTVERWAGPRARDLSRLLSLALSLARNSPGTVLGPGNRPREAPPPATSTSSGSSSGLPGSSSTGTTAFTGCSRRDSSFAFFPGWSRGSSTRGSPRSSRAAS